MTTYRYGVVRTLSGRWAVRDGVTGRNAAHAHPTVEWSYDDPTQARRAAATMNMIAAREKAQASEQGTTPQHCTAETGRENQ